MDIKKRFKGKLIVTVSIDGPKKLHDSIRGFDGCWEKAVKTFKKINSINKGNVFFGYTISKYNVGKIKETFKELKIAIPDLQASKIHVNVAQNSEIYYSTSDLNNIIIKNKIISELNSITSKRRFNISPFYLLETKFFNLLRIFILKDRYPIKKCMALNSTVSVNPKGDVYPCLFFNKKLGNLKNVNFNLNKILFNKESIKLKKNILKYCPHCWSACEAYPSILSNSF